MRKTIFTLGLMLAAALSLTSCSKNEEVNFTPELKPSFELFANLDSRTVNEGMSTKWEAKDAINVFHAVATSDDYKSDGSFSTADTSGLFKGNLSEELSAEAYDWYAFYPYSSYVKTPASTSSGYMPIGCKSNETQTQNGNNSTAHIAGGNYPLYGVVKNVPASDKPVIEMSHVSSLVEFNVTNNCGDGVIIELIELTAGEDIVGTYYINFAGEDLVCTSSGANFVSNKAKLKVSNGEAIAEGESAKFYMGIKPFKAKNTDNLTITITTNQGVYSLSKKFATTFHPGKIKTINVNMDELVGNEPSEPGEIKTIAEILAAGQGAALSGTIEGVVVSNLELNNLTSKKGMYVQDATGAIQLRLSADHTIAFGTKVSIDLTGTTLGQYSGAVQISVANDKITTVSTGNTVEPKTVTMADFLANKYEGQYIALEGVQVASSDLSKTWVMGGAHTSINVEDAAGNKFVVFSAKYATYGEQTVAQGSGTIKGISSINNGKMQIIFAQESDFAGLTGERFGDPVTPDPEPDPELPTEGETVTIDLTAQGYTNQQEVSSVTVDGVKVEFNKGENSNAPKYYTSGTAVRVYGGGYFTVSSQSTISNIVLTFGDGDGTNAINTDVGTCKNGTWTGEAKSVKFTIAGETGHRRIRKIAVTVLGEIKQSQTLSFPQREYSVVEGETFTAPDLSGAMTTVTYSSSDETVATVNETTGTVSIIGVGSTTITATAAANDVYYEGSAHYTLYVTKPISSPADDHEGNITLSTSGGTSASDAKVKISGVEYKAIKAGTSKVAGACVVTVPAGTTKLHLHTAAWKDETVEVGVKNGSTTIKTLKLTADVGVSGSSSTYTIQSTDLSKFYHVVELSGITADTKLTLTATKAKRFVVWGVTAE